MEKIKNNPSITSTNLSLSHNLHYPFELVRFRW
jgi:hypothetical protein